MSQKHPESAKKISVVVAGLGFAGLAFSKSFLKYYPRRRKEKIELIVVNDQEVISYTPLLPMVSAGTVRPTSVIVNIEELAARRGFRFIHAKVKRFDLEERRIQTDAGVIPYDYLVIATGAADNYYGIPGADVYSHPLRTVFDAKYIRSEGVSMMAERKGTRQSDYAFAIVGGGLSGVEMALILQLMLSEGASDENKAGLCIIEASDRVLPKEPPAISKSALDSLNQAGIRVITGTRVESVKQHAVRLEDGRIILADNIVWTAGITPNTRRLGLRDPSIESRTNRILVTENLRMTGFPEAFAIGDCAFVRNRTGEAFPENGAVAVQEGKYLGKLLAASVASKKRKIRPFRYVDFGHAITFGKDGIYVGPHDFVLRGFGARLASYLISILELFTWTNKIDVSTDFWWAVRNRNFVR